MNNTKKQVNNVWDNYWRSGAEASFLNKNTSLQRYQMRKFWFERIGAAKANKARGLDELAINTAKLSAPAANAWSEIAMLSFTDEDFGKLANGRYVLPWKRKKTQENRDSYRKLLILGHR